VGITPNFFIVGAPKCGTTSLSRWLAKHPEVYFSPIKEPFFFSDDLKLRDIQGINSLSRYEGLFAGVKPSHRAIGEGSTSYLFSARAVSNILSYKPTAKFVVALRNPVEMAVSFHQEQVNAFNEDVKNFLRAWDLQRKRVKGEAIPKSCQEPKMLMYKDWCSLGAQVAALLSVVDERQVHFVIFDDLVAEPDATYRRLLQFLEVSDDVLIDLHTYNKRRRVKYPKLHKVVQMAGRAKRLMGIRFNTGLSIFTTETIGMGRVDPEVRLRLEKEFEREFDLLESQLQRNLSHWRGNRGAA